MPRPKDPNANTNQAWARVSDVTKAELRGLAAKSGKPLSEITRWAIKEGLPVVRREVNKPK